ncbi:hypothetical protein [Arthrobacter sp. StoSoilB5]|uniref:hypothetical protein n=1 Tax=Arthrobacter sp. StoSoilB5 TaxID=2830992 RepID=UPI001CC3FF31|nr:hypothetical protein [Arthrobacter sp. StoSoilB5]BCW44886.1 hypothetical protein StoSoilB5_20700 [Arthrobacter sp. StoSoilB5]
MTSMIPTGSGAIELADATATDSHPAIESCEGLEPGDRIEACRAGTVHFSGRVTELMPQFDLFWATDHHGERRIVEFQEYRVRRIDTSEAGEQLGERP